MSVDMANYTTIMVEKAVATRLEGLKQTPKESKNQTVKRLLELHEGTKLGNLSEDFKDVPDEALEELLSTISEEFNRRKPKAVRGVIVDSYRTKGLCPKDNEWCKECKDAYGEETPLDCLIEVYKGKTVAEIKEAKKDV